MKAKSLIISALITTSWCFAQDSQPEVEAPPLEQAPAELPPVDLPIVEPPQIGPQVEKVISSSHQFEVLGGDGTQRGMVAILAEQTKADFLKLLGETEQQDDQPQPDAKAPVIPIVITLVGKQGDPLPRRSLAVQSTFNEAGYRLNLFMHMGRGLQKDLLNRGVLESLIYERALRDRPTASTTPLLVPAWLVAGMTEAISWKNGESDRRLYDALFKRGGLFKLDGLFAVKQEDWANLDAATRAAFQVSSGALVLALLEQPKGKEGFHDFLGEAASYQGEMPYLLRKYFPELNLSETSMAKWWMLQLAMNGTPPLTDILTIQDTEKGLEDILRLRFRNKDGESKDVPLGSWEEVIKLDAGERADAVKIAEDALLRLSYRCFPSYRPLLQEYQSVLSSISHGDSNGLAAKIQELQEHRSVMSTRADRGRDVLDWFEITRARETSGEFDDYLKLKERLKSKPKTRDDEISNYLDRMEKLFDRSDDPEAPEPAH
ncbi:hypothetical protein JIN85_13660 [Luteolibacter pohnpeiensis]|uniref:Uncharacterized protein n=1 Tax=Luteolibacter pohnpeiensis TaxID=454153 RepID=A0A934S7W4_9BACT|nr:hypothetical protein [Luteolibacter pohnpeiensis]MBK1883468.1 hypothetical protein [Luteolibacter pohnpeiensis]